MSKVIVLNEYLLLTSKRARQMFEKGLLEEGIINLREELIEKFKSINEFKTKYVFWHNHAGLMTYLSRQEEEKLNELGANLYRDKESKGLIEPEPNNDAETEFVVKWHINNNLQYYKDKKNLKNTFKILSFEEYKKDFLINIEKKINPLEFANEELKKVNYYLDFESLATKSIPINLNSPFDKNKTTIKDLIYNMTNNNYQIDYVLLRAYIKSGFFKYEELSNSLTPIQYKRFLEVWVHDKLDALKSIGKKNNNAKAGLVLGYSNEQLIELYNNLIALNFLHYSTNVEHFISAFNGEPLSIDYKVLKWTTPTIGAICVSYLTKNKPRWKYSSSLFEKANYKQLLAQSRRGEKHDEVIAKLKKIIV